MTARAPEQRERLWRVFASPAVWAAHFMLSYVTAAVWHAKVAGGPSPVRWAIGVYTAVALAAIVAVAWRAWRRHRLWGAPPPPHDADTPEDRHRFLAYATLLLSGLSAIAVVFAAAAAVLAERGR